MSRRGARASRRERNLALKLASGAVAVLLWVTVRVDGVGSEELSGIPVEVALSDPAWSVSAPPEPSTVRIRISGPTRVLLRLSVDRPRILIPIAAVTAPDTTVSLSREWLRIEDPSGVVLEEFQPASVRLRFVRTTSGRTSEPASPSVSPAAD